MSLVTATDLLTQDTYATNLDGRWRLRGRMRFLSQNVNKPGEPPLWVSGLALQDEAQLVVRLLLKPATPAAWLDQLVDIAAWVLVKPAGRKRSTWLSCLEVHSVQLAAAAAGDAALGGSEPLQVKQQQQQRCAEAAEGFQDLRQLRAGKRQKCCHVTARVAAKSPLLSTSGTRFFMAELACQNGSGNELRASLLVSRADALAWHAFLRQGRAYAFPALQTGEIGTSGRLVLAPSAASKGGLRECAALAEDASTAAPGDGGGRGSLADTVTTPWSGSEPTSSAMQTHSTHLSGSTGGSAGSSGGAGEGEGGGGARPAAALSAPPDTMHYAGVITHARVLGIEGLYRLDDSFKLFMQLYPCATLGAGLRVGAAVLIQNAHPVRLWGKLEGFGACLRTSYEVQSFSPKPPADAPYAPLYFNKGESSLQRVAWRYRLRAALNAKLAPALRSQGAARAQLEAWLLDVAALKCSTTAAAAPSCCSGAARGRCGSSSSGGPTAAGAGRGGGGSGGTCACGGGASSCVAASGVRPAGSTQNGSSEGGGSRRGGAGATSGGGGGGARKRNVYDEFLSHGADTCPAASAGATAAAEHCGCADAEHRRCADAERCCCAAPEHCCLHSSVDLAAPQWAAARPSLRSGSSGGGGDGVNWPVLPTLAQLLSLARARALAALDDGEHQQGRGSGRGVAPGVASVRTPLSQLFAHPCGALGWLSVTPLGGGGARAAQLWLHDATASVQVLLLSAAGAALEIRSDDCGRRQSGADACNGACAHPVLSAAVHDPLSRDDARIGALSAACRHRAADAPAAACVCCCLDALDVVTEMVLLRGGGGGGGGGGGDSAAAAGVDGVRQYVVTSFSSLEQCLVPGARPAAAAAAAAAAAQTLAATAAGAGGAAHGHDGSAHRQCAGDGSSDRSSAAPTHVHSSSQHSNDSVQQQNDSARHNGDAASISSSDRRDDDAVISVRAALRARADASGEARPAPAHSRESVAVRGLLHSVAFRNKLPSAPRAQARGSGGGGAHEAATAAGGQAALSESVHDAMAGRQLCLELRGLASPDVVSVYLDAVPSCWPAGMVPGVSVVEVRGLCRRLANKWRNMYLVSSSESGAACASTVRVVHLCTPAPPAGRVAHDWQHLPPAKVQIASLTHPSPLVPSRVLTDAGGDGDAQLRAYTRIADLVAPHALDYSLHRVCLTVSSVDSVKVAKPFGARGFGSSSSSGAAAAKWEAIGTVQDGTGRAHILVDGPCVVELLRLTPAQRQAVEQRVTPSAPLEWRWSSFKGRDWGGAAAWSAAAAAVAAGGSGSASGGGSGGADAAMAVLEAAARSGACGRRLVMSCTRVPKLSRDGSRVHGECWRDTVDTGQAKLSVFAHPKLFLKVLALEDMDVPASQHARRETYRILDRLRSQLQETADDSGAATKKHKT